MLLLRHAIGATFMDFGRNAEAESVYLEDVLRHPENGWSLYVLVRSLRMQDEKAEATTIQPRFEKA